MTTLTLNNVSPALLRAIADLLDEEPAVDGTARTTEFVVQETGAVTVEQITQAEVNAGNLPTPTPTPQPVAQPTPTPTPTPTPQTVAKYQCPEGQYTMEELTGFGFTPEAIALLPQVPPVAQPTPQTVAQPAAAAGTLDTAKFPWDKRIHGRDKKQNEDGTWKLIRSIEKKNPGLVAQVRAEFTGGAQPVAQAAGQPQPAAQPSPTVTTGSATYGSIIQQIVAGCALHGSSGGTEGFTAVQAQNVLIANGVKDTNELATREDVFAQVALGLAELT